MVNSGNDYPPGKSEKGKVLGLFIILFIYHGTIYSDKANMAISISFLVASSLFHHCHLFCNQSIYYGEINPQNLCKLQASYPFPFFIFLSFFLFSFFFFFFFPPFFPERLPMQHNILTPVDRPNIWEGNKEKQLNFSPSLELGVVMSSREREKTQKMKSKATPHKKANGEQLVHMPMCVI